MNTGVFLMRSSTWSWWLLDECEAAPARSGNYPFEYEQRAAHFLLQASVWRPWSEQVRECLRERAQGY